MTAEDRRMIYYFGVEKGCLDNWSCWGWKKEEIFKEAPNLEFALNQKEMADKYLDTILREIGEIA